MRMSPAVTFVLLIVVVLACAGVLLAQPRAVPPAELPSLVLPEAPVRAALAQDARLAAQAPKSERAAKLDALLLEVGRNEQTGGQDRQTRTDQARRMADDYAALVREAGVGAVIALRAMAAERLDQALDGKLPHDRGLEVIGGFSTVLEREGCTRDGELVAPRFVVRTLFKARWNLMHGRRPTDLFASIEKRALFGWQALHADHLPLDQRLDALRSYAQHGGTRVREAAAALLFRGGELEAAQRPLSAAYRASSSLRLRNGLLALKPPPAPE